MIEITDPMEKLIADALVDANIRFEHEQAPHHLDFYLPDFDLYIEVKRMHSPRIERQMARVSDVIAAQGDMAVRFLADLLRSAEV